MKNALLILFGSLLAGIAVVMAAEPPQHELGIIDYSGYYQNNPYQKKITEQNKQLLAYFEKLGRKGQLIPVADLNDEAFLATFKRIFIPSKALAFSPSAYAALEKYVQAGGLLIANTVLFGIDVNEDYVFNHHQDDKTFPKRVGSPLLGLANHQTGIIEEMTILEPSPLTAGIEQDAVKLGKLTAWFPRNHSAVVLAAGKGTQKERNFNEVPLLAFKHQDRGACLYLGFLLPSVNETVNLIVKNLLSEKTREWQVDTSGKK